MYCGRPNVVNTPAVRTTSCATDTSPNVSGEMKRVSTSVPTSPIARVPTLVAVIHRAPRTVFCWSDTGLPSAPVERFVRVDHPLERVALRRVCARGGAHLGAASAVRDERRERVAQ